MNFVEINLDGESAAYTLNTRGELIEVSDRTEDGNWDWNKPTTTRDSGPLVDPLLSILLQLENVA